MRHFLWVVLIRQYHLKQLSVFSPMQRSLIVFDAKVFWLQPLGTDYNRVFQRGVSRRFEAPTLKVGAALLVGLDIGRFLIPGPGFIDQMDDQKHERDFDKHANHGCQGGSRFETEK